MNSLLKHRARILVVLFTLCSAAPTILFPNPLQAQTAAKGIDPALLAKAQGGDTAAEMTVGLDYANGEGVPKDFMQAAVWFRKAAEQGNPDAQYFLGGMYREGDGVPQDFMQAAIWYRMAADQGNADAQYYLGKLYADGQGVKQDYAEAAELYRKAADKGGANAQYSEYMLGYLYSQGRGVPQDYSLAATWWRKAAELGNAPAQASLATLYENGLGVPHDSAQAALWKRKAADQGLRAEQTKISQPSANTMQGSSIEQTFPLQIIIESSRMTDFSASISQQEQAQAANVGMELPGFATFFGRINGEDHWVFDCRKENALRESLPCTDLPVGEYRGRWIHDHSLLQIVDEVDSSRTRFLMVSDNPKSPPADDDPLMHDAVFDFPVRFPDGKSLKDYPVLVHVYGGYSIDLPIATLPAHSRCNAYTWTAYQTSINCTDYPPVEIHRGYVGLDVSIGYMPFVSLHCEAKWRWSRCSYLDPGLYYARAEKDKFILLTHDVNGKPEEVGFVAQEAGGTVQSPIK